MKSLIQAMLFAVAIAAPVASFAQSARPLTRDEVRADLVRVEKAGYNPNDWMHYPENIQTAEARVAAQTSNSAYGRDSSGSSQTGQKSNTAVSTYSPPVESVGH